ncbi:MAG: hypothetical protein ACRC6V_07870 [Bacteroidales bacterium]
MDNKAQPSPSLDKKKISVDRIKELEKLLGFASNPDYIDWDTTEIEGEGGKQLLFVLQNYRASFQVLKQVWQKVYGEELK